jgi:hypothetical protein
LIALTQDEKVALILSVGKGGVSRGRPLSPVEVSSLIARCVDNGESIEELSRQLHLGRDMVSRFLSLQKLSPTTRALVDWGSTGTTLSFTSAHMLSRLPTENLREDLARRAIELGFRKADIEQVVQRFNRSGLGLDEAINRIVALRPTIERRHLLIGAVTDRATSQALSRQSQERRNRLLLAASHELLEEDVIGRLVPDRFTISADDALAKRILGLKPDFETAINERLSSAVRQG